MALTLPYTDLSGVVDDTKLEADLTAIANKFGSIDNSDIAAGASIATSKLAASNYELVLSAVVQGTDLNSATTAYFLVGGIPYDTQADTYTISAIETLTYAAAAATTAAQYTLLYGTAAQLIAGTATSIKTGISTGTGAAVWTGTALASFTTSVATSSTPAFFVLDVTTQGVDWDAADRFVISIKLKKALRT